MTRVRAGPEKCPRPVGETGYAGGHSERQNHTTSVECYRQPSRCELHGIRIVDQFPRRCPLGTANPLDTLARLQAVGWRELRRAWNATAAEHAGGLAVLDTVDVCNACVPRLAPHHTVRRLRRELGVSR